MPPTDPTQSDGRKAQPQPGRAGEGQATVDAPQLPKKRRRGRPMRIGLKRKQAIAAEKELAKQARIKAAEAEQEKRLAAAKAAMEELITAGAEAKREEMRLRRPTSVSEWCRLQGYAEDLPYHPRYNIPGVSPLATDQQLEGLCFLRSWSSEWGGLGGYQHLKHFITLTWPWITENPWFDSTLKAIADDDWLTQIGEVRLKFINLTGPGSASKTFAAGVAACAWYMVDAICGLPARTSITLTSTSKSIINQRIWPVIQRCFHEAIDASIGDKLKWGHMIDSQKMVVALREDGSKDAQHSICALAVESGEVNKAVDNIKGRHAERMMLIVDEANSTPEAIFNTIPNMLTSVKELVVIVIGNAISRLDPHGLCCEPAKGWKHISIDADQWETKGVAKWGIGPGVCLHYDGSKSPNVLAGQTLYKHIYSYERWQHVLRMGDEYRNTVQHWSQDRGFWPPDGLQTTIFSEADFLNHDGQGKLTWLSSPRPCASLDPAFGGDACVLQFGQLGQLYGHRQGLQLTDWLLVPFDPESPDAIDFQIARFVITRCKERGVDPAYFGCDSTGTGRGVAAFLEQNWSPRICKIEFGGNASTQPASTTDPRESCEIYANRVTQLWYFAKELLLCDQLKGFSLEAIKEATNRNYLYKARRYQAETKEDMRKRLGYSPDRFDAVVVLAQVARQHGLEPVVAAVRQRQALEEAASLEPADVINFDCQATGAFEQYAPV